MNGNPIRVLAVMEATHAAGPARNLIEFARRAAAPAHQMRPVALSRASYRRRDIETPFIAAARAAGIPLKIAAKVDPADLQYFKQELRPGIGLGLGVVDIKVNTVESPELIAGRIETAAKIVGKDRITWVHPDCGFWMNKRSIADRKMEALVKGRDLYLGRRG